MQTQCPTTTAISPVVHSSAVSQWGRHATVAFAGNSSASVPTDQEHLCHTQTQQGCNSPHKGISTMKMFNKIHNNKYQVFRVPLGPWEYLNIKAANSRPWKSLKSPGIFGGFGKFWLDSHTHTHTRLTALCPGLRRWAGTREEKPIWILLKQETVSGSGISWAICKSAPRSRQITTPAPHARLIIWTFRHVTLNSDNTAVLSLDYLTSN